MNAAASVYSNLNALRSNPVNQQTVDAENDRIDLIREDYEAVIERAIQLYRYPPLVEGVFPDGAPLKRIEFRNKYGAAMSELFGTLKAGGPPGSRDIETMRERRKNEKAADLLSGARSVSYGDSEAQFWSPAAVLTAAGVRENATARATIAKARSFYCYAVRAEDEKPPQTIASLDFFEMMKDTGTIDAPEAVDTWRAQVEYWIQKDVVEAIVAVNEEAAEAAKAAGGEAWVGTMAVKELIAIRFSEYVPPDGEIFGVGDLGGFTAVLPPGTGASVFTGSTGNDFFDVVQFSVKLIMDQRDILRLVDHLCADSFHTLVRAGYEAVEPNRAMRGKIYGSEPAVNVLLEFETVMLGEVFRPLMPIEVCEEYEIPCPPRDGEEEGG